MPTLVPGPAGTHVRSARTMRFALGKCAHDERDKLLFCLKPANYSVYPTPSRYDLVGYGTNFGVMRHTDCELVPLPSKTS